MVALDRSWRKLLPCSQRAVRRSRQAGGGFRLEWLAEVPRVSGDLTKVVEATGLSRVTFCKILENRLWTWFYNAAAILVAAA